MPIGDIPGHLWHTATPIEFAATGAAMPPIPLTRAAGPVCLAARFTRTTDSGVVIGLRGTEAFFGLPMLVMWDYGTLMRLCVGGLGNKIEDFVNPAAPSTHTIIAVAAAASSLEDVGDGVQTGALGNATATTEIRIGHSVDGDGNAWFRAAGTLHRAALFARDSLTGAERAELLAWLADEVTEPETITATLAAVEAGTDAAAGALRVALRAALVATEAGSDASAGEIAVAWPGVSATMQAVEAGADGAAGAAAVRVRASLAAQESGADAASGRTEIGVRATMATAEAGADTAAGTISTGWAAVTAALAAVEAGQDRAAGTATVAIRAGLSTDETGADTASGAVSVEGQTGITARLAAVEAGQDTATGAASIGLRARLTVIEGGVDRAAGAAGMTVRASLTAVEIGADVVMHPAVAVPVPYAYPGEKRAGRLIHGSRYGRLLGSPRIGKLLRG